MSETTYEDITERFKSACSQLKYSEIVALPDFSYLESMSAVELMDQRLDSGMALLSRSLPSPDAQFNESQVQGILNRFLLHLGQWLEGQSLPHTFYSSIFLHRQELLEDSIIIKAITTAGLHFSEILHKLIHSTSCLREDDYAYASLNFEGIITDETESLLLKAEKTTENEDILARLKFVRGLHCVLQNILKLDGLVGADKHLAFANKQFLLIKEIETADVSSLFDKNFCLTRLPHFLPNKIYEVQNYTLQKALSRIGLLLKSLEYIIKLKDISDLEELIEALISIPSFDILTRTLYEALLFPQGTSQILLFGRTPLTELIIKSMQKFGIDTNFLNLAEEFQYYLSRVEIVLKEYILLKLKNKTRQQRVIAKYLSDFNILVSEAHFLSEKVYGKNSNKAEKQLLFQWIFQKTTKAMIEYLRFGFELQLYTDKDIGMTMFYMDFLYGVVYSNLNSQAGFLKLKQSKRKSKIDIKANEVELKYSLGAQFLCRGIVRFYILLLNTTGVQEDEKAESVRFQKRFRAFKAVHIPQLIEYPSFSSIKTIPADFSIEKFVEACKECFDVCKKNLSEIESVKHVKPLLRICVKNILALSKAKKLEWKCKTSYEFTEDKCFPVFLIDPLPSP